MAQTPAQRRAAQRRTARQLKRGERPLGGQYQRFYVAALRRQALENFRTRLSHYSQYNDDKVKEGIYEVMDMDQVIWTANADTEDIRARAASSQYVIHFEGQDRNPWWYH